MEEHGMYFAKKEFYEVIRTHGGVWNDSKDIRSCFYHIGNTNEKSIFFISDVVPFTEEYVDREYLNKSKKIHIIKNKVLLAELEYKLSRILEFEKRKPNYFRQHITDIKHYFIRKVSGRREHCIITHIHRLHMSYRVNLSSLLEKK